MRIALPPTIDAAAFAMSDAAGSIVVLRGDTMGTTWSVRFVPPIGCHALTIRRAIATRLTGLVREMSHWAPDSLLSRFNRSAAGTWTRLPRDFARVVAQGLSIAAITDGAFDPAIGRLVDDWGFGRFPTDAPPDARTIGIARACSGWRRLTFVPAGPWLRQPGGIALDLSGIAKGYAVDAVAALLAGLGVRHSLVEIGGELVGTGIRPDGEPWWVDLEDPPTLALPRLRVALHGIAVATSGDYRRGGHTLDPRTGRPIGTGVVSASAIHGTAMDADAWATALTVLGATEGLALAGAAGIAARLVTVIDGVVSEHLSPALRAMLDD